MRRHPRLPRSPWKARHCFADVLAELPGREAEVLMLRYGLADGQVRTLTEVGNELGLSRERVRQIERKALVALRDSGVAAQLRDLAAA